MRINSSSRGGILGRKRRFFLLFFAFFIRVLHAETESEKVFREAIPGHYSRVDGGMMTLHLALNRDATYVYQIEGDMGGIERTKGKWSIKDDIVVLEGDGPLHHFRIYSSKRVKGLSLLPLDDEKWRGRDEDEQRLFLRQSR